jgi:hypothetical protein
MVFKNRNSQHGILDTFYQKYYTITICQTPKIPETLETSLMDFIISRIIGQNENCCFKKVKILKYFSTIPIHHV